MAHRERAGLVVSPLYMGLAILFVTCLLISNLIAGKLISVFGLVLPAAVILFPVTYIFGDVLTEVYGFKGSRLIIWMGFAANLFMALVFIAVLALPYPSFWDGQPAYQSVLGTTPRIVLASLLGYLAGEFANSVVLSRLKVATGGKWLWVRTVGSTVVGQGIDTLLFISIAFSGTVPWGVLGQMVLAQYIWKVAYEASATPLTYMVVGWVKRKEGLDIYDYGVKYNPFGLGV